MTFPNILRKLEEKAEQKSKSPDYLSTSLIGKYRRHQDVLHPINLHGLGYFNNTGEY